MSSSRLESSHSVSANISKLYALTMVQTALTGVPVIVLFVQENGVSLRQFFLLETIFSLAMVAAEIPSGYLSDRWGRKNTLLLAAAASVLGACAYALGREFWHFVVAETLGLLIVWSLVEPHRHKPQPPQHWSAIADACAHSLFRSPQLRSVMTIYACISTLTLALVWFSQPYQTAVGLPLALFGLAHAVIILAGAVASKCVGWAERQVSDRALLTLIAFVVIGSCVALSVVTGYVGLAFLLLGRASWGALHPLTTDIINKLTGSEIRATVLSAPMFLMRVVFAAVAPVLGWLADAWSLREAILLAGILGAAAAAVSLIGLRRAWK